MRIEDMASMDLAGKVALVTGAGRNLGRQICLTLATRGCDVGVNARSNRAEAESVATAVAALGRGSVALLGDVSSPEDVTRMVDELTQRFGRIDILVNNAAIRPHAPFLELSDSDWKRVLDVNLSGAFYCCRAVAPIMVDQRSGTIVNVSGMSAYVGAYRQAHISASKAGLDGLTRALAAELGEYGIRVNSIVPSSIATQGKIRDPERHQREMQLRPLHREGTVEEVASLCAFLVSDQAAYITGQTIHVNGGRLMP